MGDAKKIMRTIAEKLIKIAIGKGWKNSPRLKPISKAPEDRSNVVDKVIKLQYESLKLKERLSEIEKEIVNLGGKIVSEKNKELELDVLKELNK